MMKTAIVEITCEQIGECLSLLQDHGFLVLSQSAEVLYKTTDYYAPQHERCILWNDPDLAIDWTVTTSPIVSAKDQVGQSFKTAEFP